LRLGGRLTLSDDSHGVAQVGLNFALVKNYLESLGVENLYYLDKPAEDIQSQSKLPLVIKKLPLAGLLGGLRYPTSVGC
jgi:histidinol-phosphatase (PHP family)